MLLGGLGVFKNVTNQCTKINRAIFSVFSNKWLNPTPPIKAEMHGISFHLSVT